MATEITLVPDAAETLYINHPEANYGIFCWNSKGDLFLNSDWGFYGYAWRHYGTGTFKDFLGRCNAEYIMGKFEINYNQMGGKKLSASWKKGVTVLLGELIKYCKETAA